MARKWISGAIRKPGSLTAAAKRAGAFTGGKIRASWLRTKAKAKGTMGRRARLAITLRKLPRARGRRK